MSCSVLQRVTVCCGVLQSAATTTTACHFPLVRCSEVQYVAGCCIQQPQQRLNITLNLYIAASCSVMQCEAVHFSVLQCVAGCCSALQSCHSKPVNYSELQCVAA